MIKDEDLVVSGGGSLGQKRKRSSKYPSSEISELFSELCATHSSNYSASTQKNYEERCRKLLSILHPDSCEEFIRQLLLAEETIEKIKASDLTHASQMEVIKAIPCIFKVISGEELKKEEKAPYTKVMMLHSIDYDRKKAMEKRDPLPTFAEFLEMVKSEYGEDSEEFLLMSLYSELTCRDNFCQILLLPRFDGRRINHNYIIANNTETASAVINCHKTQKYQGTIRVTFSKKVSNRLKRYINTHKMQYEDCLFPQQSLSGYVSRILDRCHLSGGISTLRDMRVSETINDPSKTSEDLQRLSQEMGHRIKTACSVYYHQPGVSPSGVPPPEPPN